MFQLKLNQNFTKITMDIPHWENHEDIPKNIKDFIMMTSNSRVIYEESTNFFYCAKCMNKLDNHNYCSICHLHHPPFASKIEDLEGNKDVTIVSKVDLSYKYSLNHTSNYLVFDIVDSDVWLYFISEEVSYDNPFYRNFFKTTKLSIDLSKSYLIGKEGITNLKTNTFTSFKFLYDCNEEINTNPGLFFERMEKTDKYNVYDDITFNDHLAYLYTDNLIELKHTIYKYSRIWELTPFFKEQNYFTFEQLTLYPLYYPQFEYLVNYKLYALAFEATNFFSEKRNFEKIFGVEKKYLPFMQENNINWRQLKILQLYPTDNIDVIKFFAGWQEAIKNLVIDYKVDLEFLMKYLLNLNLSSEHISDYIDYIDMTQELGLNLKDKKVLYPQNLREAHDELFNQIQVIEDPMIDEKIRVLADALVLNKYEDDNYIIFPATSIADLVEESRQQKNCVRTYCERVAENKCHIYFMREKKNVKKSFVTIEVINNKVIQARIKYNELPSDEIKQILRKWEKQLIPIDLSL